MMKSENGQHSPTRTCTVSPMMNAQPSFQVTPLPAAVAQQVRREMKDESGRKGVVRQDGERHQCRVCLKLSEPEERLFLLSYSPFDLDTPYAEVGPIFIHEHPCTPHGSDRYYPSEFPRREVVLRAYNKDDEIEDAELVGERVVEDVIEELLENPRVSFIHARNSTYGCYMFQINRSLETSTG